MELILIRHALPMRVERGDGGPADPPLSDLGKEQARRLAHWMAGERLDVLYSSPLKRALMTAEYLAEGQGLDIRVEAGVAEFDRHSPIYIPLEELKAEDSERWRALVRGGFEDLFDLKAFQKVVLASLERIIRENRGRRVAVVCHGGIINIWAAHVLGLNRYLFFAPEYTSLNRFLASRNGQYSLASLNETPHLFGVRLEKPLESV